MYRLIKWLSRFFARVTHLVAFIKFPDQRMHKKISLKVKRIIQPKGDVFCPICGAEKNIHHLFYDCCFSSDLVRNSQMDADFNRVICVAFPTYVGIVVHSGKVKLRELLPHFGMVLSTELQK